MKKINYIETDRLASAAEAKFGKYEYYLDFTAEALDDASANRYGQRFWLILLSGYVNTVLAHESQIAEAGFNGSRCLFHISNNITRFSKRKIIANIKFAVRAFNSRQALRFAERQGKNASEVAIGDGVSLISGAYLLPHFEVLPLTKKKDLNFRKKIDDLAQKQEDVIMKIILLNLPMIWVEHLEYLVSKIKNLCAGIKTIHAERIYTHIETLICAYSVSHGAELYYYQPGGHMGDLRYNKGLFSQLKKCDKFFTYGWEINSKTVPGRALRLEKAAAHYAVNKKVTNFDITYVLSVLSSKSRARYIRDLEALIGVIDGESYGRQCLRPRGSTRWLPNSWDARFLPRETRKQLYIDRAQIPLTTLMGRSRLVLMLDHPSTGFLEAMYCRHPVMALIENRTSYSDLYQPILERFVDLGVCHYSTQSLAELLNKIDIGEWWNSVLGSEAFRTYDRLFLGGASRIGASD